LDEIKFFIFFHTPIHLFFFVLLPKESVIISNNILAQIDYFFCDLFGVFIKLFFVFRQKNPQPFLPLRTVSVPLSTLGHLLELLHHSGDSIIGKDQFD
jgi:hypothetical protein